MWVGYIIVGVLWALCTAGLFAAGAVETFGGAVIAGLCAALILALPAAIVAGGLWRLARAVSGMGRAREARRQRRGVG